MNADAPLQPGVVLSGKFKIVRVLGTGGMGAVYEIEHLLTKHRRALKLLHRRLAAHPDIVERFLREASAAGRIGNEHIIETFDAGVLESGEPYLVMELLAGEPLAARIERGRLALPEIAAIIGQACNGVQAAHDARIVHRDLKPDNVFVSERNGRPFAKLLDFGISKFDVQLTEKHDITQEGALMGTPYYMPPEQVRGVKDIDARADVYSLGVMLYECASGQRPYDADTLPNLSLKIHEGRPVPLGLLRPELPRAFCDLVAAAMKSDREARLATARELGAALVRFESGEIVAEVSDAPEPSPWKRTRVRWALPSVAVASVALAVVVGTRDRKLSTVSVESRSLEADASVSVQASILPLPPLSPPAATSATALDTAPDAAAAPRTTRAASPASSGAPLLGAPDKPPTVLRAVESANPYR